MSDLDLKVKIKNNKTGEVKIESTIIHTLQSGNKAYELLER